MKELNKVVSVKAKDNFILFVTLSDGRAGEFDVSPYLDKGIFIELKDPEYFKLARTAFGGVVWPNEQGFSADTIEVEMNEIKTSEVR